MRAAYFLACKVEENLVRINDVVRVFHSASEKGLQPFDEGMDTFWTVRNSIEEYEDLILKEMGFHVFPQSPLKYILNYCKTLQVSLDVAQMAWNVCADSFLTNACVYYAPWKIATAAIYLATRICGKPLPEASEESAWWNLCDTELVEITDIVQSLQHLYSLKRICRWEFAPTSDPVRALIVDQLPLPGKTPSPIVVQEEPPKKGSPDVVEVPAESVKAVEPVMISDSEKPPPEKRPKEEEPAKEDFDILELVETAKAEVIERERERKSERDVDYHHRDHRDYHHRRDDGDKDGYRNRDRDYGRKDHRHSRHHHHSSSNKRY